jgi:hypothetical protein
LGDLRTFSCSVKVLHLIWRTLTERNGDMWIVCRINVPVQLQTSIMWNKASRNLKSLQIEGLPLYIPDNNETILSLWHRGRIRSEQGDAVDRVLLYTNMNKLCNLN